MTKDEALDLALEIMRNQGDVGVDEWMAAEAAIKQARSAPVQEPVAWRRREVGGYWQYFGWKEAGMNHEFVERWNKNGFECEAIPATPQQRQWVDLSDDEMKDALVSVDAETKRLPPGMKAFAQAIEQLLKEKNT